MNKTCDHFWQTGYEQGFGWVSVCQNCGLRETAEHSQECFDILARHNWDQERCICGATQEFIKQGEAGA